MNAALLCLPNPEQVPLNSASFHQIAAQQDEGRLATFVTRVVRHAGGDILDAAAFSKFVQSISTFDDVTKALASQPTWATWDELAICVADRSSNPGRVGLAIQRVCLSSGFNCS